MCMAINWVNGATAKEVTSQVTMILDKTMPQIWDVIVGHGVNWSDQGGVFELFVDANKPEANSVRKYWHNRKFPVQAGGQSREVTVKVILKKELPSLCS